MTVIAVAAAAGGGAALVAAILVWYYMRRRAQLRRPHGHLPTQDDETVRERAYASDLDAPVLAHGRPLAAGDVAVDMADCYGPNDIVEIHPKLIFELGALSGTDLGLPSGADNNPNNNYNFNNPDDPPPAPGPPVATVATLLNGSAAGVSGHVPPPSAPNWFESPRFN
jgi:hypothetical protein